MSKIAGKRVMRRITHIYILRRLLNMERMWVLVVKRSLEMRSFILLNDAVHLCWMLLARATVGAA